jgi:putative transposon-encoded protein
MNGSPSRAMVGVLPSLRATVGEVVVRKVERLFCVRFGSARYSVPARHIGRRVEVRVVDGVLEVILLGTVQATHRPVEP